MLKSLLEGWPELRVTQGTEGDQTAGDGRRSPSLPVHRIWRQRRPLSELGFRPLAIPHLMAFVALPIRQSSTSFLPGWAKTRRQENTRSSKVTPSAPKDPGLTVVLFDSQMHARNTQHPTLKAGIPQRLWASLCPCRTNRQPGRARLPDAQVPIANCLNQETVSPS